MNHFPKIFSLLMLCLMSSTLLIATEDDCEDPSDSFELQKSSKHFRVLVHADCHCPDGPCQLKQFRIKVTNQNTGASIYNKVLSKGTTGGGTINVPNSTVKIKLNISVSGEKVTVDGEMIWGGKVRATGSASAECEGDCSSSAPRIGPNKGVQITNPSVHFQQLAGSVWANQSETILNLEIPKSGQLNVQIFDLSGNRIYEQSTKVSKGHYSRNIQLAEQLPSGIYLMHIHIQGQRITKKFLLPR